MKSLRRNLAALRREARKRAVRKLVQEVEERVSAATHVEPCPECESTQLCEPECSLAPWNLEPEK